jgi:glycosyltransferase involved in cell wall biosynthesis
MSYGLCFVCDEYPAVVNEYGGLGTAFRDQAETFARRGRRVDVVCRTGDRPPGVHDVNGVRVHVVRPSTLPKARAIVDRLRLGRIIRRICVHPSDIVVSAEYAGPVVLKWFRNPLVVQCEGSMTLSALQQNRPASRLARFFERRTVDAADALAAVSQFGAGATLTALGARPRPVRVVPNPVNADRFAPAPEEVLPNRVLFVGKLNRLKGLFVLLDAMRQVWEKVPAATLVLVGGDLVEDGSSCLQRLVEQLDASSRDRVVYLGRIGRSAVAKELRQCTLLVLPSFTEMCPVAVLEAMSCGRPVVASNRGGIPEVVEDGQTGLLADPDRPASFATAIVRLLTNSAEAEAMGAAGRRRVLERYTSDAIADHLQRVFDELRGPAA